jgi:hypothetical protein
MEEIMAEESMRAKKPAAPSGGRRPAPDFVALMEDEGRRDAPGVEVADSELMTQFSASKGKGNPKRQQQQSDEELFWGAATKEDLLRFRGQPRRLATKGEVLAEIIEEVTGEQGMEEFATSIAAYERQKLVAALETVCQTRQEAVQISDRYLRKYPE